MFGESYLYLLAPFRVMCLVEYYPNTVFKLIRLLILLCKDRVSNYLDTIARHYINMTHQGEWLGCCLVTMEGQTAELS